MLLREFPRIQRHLQQREQVGLCRGRGEGATEADKILATPTGALELQGPAELFHVGCNGQAILAQLPKSLNKDQRTVAKILGERTR